GQAFCVAASFGQINILQMLVQRGELFDYSVIEVVVEEAVKDRDTKVLEFLLETPNPIPCPWPAGRDVAIAAEIGYTDYVKLLLAHNIDPTVDKNYPLRIASRKGHADIVRLLLADKRVNPQAEFNAAIYHAATNGYTGIVRQLLKSGAWPDVDGGNSPLQTACTNGHVEVVKALLETGKVSAAGPCNMPIFLAAEHGHADIVELLLQKGVEPSDCLSNAVLKGHIDVVRVLLKCERVDPTLFNNHALQSAVELGNLEVAKLLVQ
ncbi:ankyrin repeat-containing domain protein, partial [Obelidium mucronatum]